jgi:hypothetical protein
MDLSAMPYFRCYVETHTGVKGSFFLTSGGGLEDEGCSLNGWNELQTNLPRLKAAWTSANAACFSMRHLSVLMRAGASLCFF